MSDEKKEVESGPLIVEAPVAAYKGADFAINGQTTMMLIRYVCPMCDDLHELGFEIPPEHLTDIIESLDWCRKRAAS